MLRPRTINPNRSFDGRYRELYPEGVYLKPGSKKHEFLAGEVYTRAIESSAWISARHGTWDAVDEMLKAYIPLDDYEAARQEEDSRLPVSIVVPEAYAVLETYQSYLLTVFGQDPLFSYAPVGPEDSVGAALLENVVNQQVARGKGLLQLATHFRDVVAYGLGVMAVPWDVVVGKRTKTVPDGVMDDLLGYIPQGFRKVTEDSLLFEGSRLEPIDPRAYLPDPTVDIADVQKGEYVGWVEQTTYLALLRAEAAPDSPYFNVRYLEDEYSLSSFAADHPSTGEDLASASGVWPSSSTQRVDVVHMYIDLIPADWGLGSGREPEKWRFSLAGDTVLIAAMPMDLNHELFPVVVAAPGTDGHGGTPSSKLELTHGYSKYINFLFNSRVVNLLDVNNRFLVNEDDINMEDVLTGSPLIRARRSAFNNRPITDSFQQLNIQDVTRGNMADLGMVRQLMRETTGAVDALQGTQRTRGERVTAKEFGDTRAAAMGKMAYFAKILSLQSLYDAALMFASHTQQFMSEATYTRTTGRLEEVLRQEYGFDIEQPYVNVRPFDLDVAYDVRPHMASLPGGDNTDWVTVLSIMMKNPEAAQAFDLTRLVQHVLRKLGAENIHEFRRKAPVGGVSVLPQEQLAAQAQQGNLVAV